MFKLYIDPGTGSMLFTIVMGLLSIAVFFIRKVIIKLRFFFSSKDSKIIENDLQYVIFTDDKRYWNGFKLICDEFEQRKIELHYFTASPDDPALDSNYEYVKCQFIGEGNKAISKMNILKADIVLTTTPSLDVFQWKRSKTVKYYAHMMHDVGFGFYRIYGVDYFDAVLLPGPYFEHLIRELEVKRNLPAKEITVVGLPYLDALYRRAQTNKRETKTGQRTVLLAPSWGASSILSRYGARMLDTLIATGYNIIVRPHPQSFKSEKQLLDELMEKYPNTDKFSWNSDNDNFDCLNQADILISDYSGVMCDFALVFNKPILYANFDFDDSIYDIHWLDEEPWLFQKIAKFGRPIEENFEATLKNTIDECISSNAILEAIEQTKQEGWQCIGESAKNIADFLINKHAELESADKKQEVEKGKK